MKKSRVLQLVMLLIAATLCLTGCGGEKMEEHPDFAYVLNDTNEFARVLLYKGAASEVTIPETLNGKPVKEVMATTFANAPHVTSVTFGPNVTKIEDPSFKTLPTLTTINVSAENTSYAVVDGVLFHKKMKTVYCYPQGLAGESYTMPDSVTTVGAYAFYNTGLKSVTMSDNVAKVYAGAFAENKELETVNFSSKLKQIYESAFENCVKLTGVKLPASTTSIAENCFAGCASLTEIVIPDKVASIAVGAFKNCTALTDVTVQGKASTLQRIAEDTFNGCSALTNVHFDVELLGIADRAFKDCAALTDLTTVNEKLSVIGEEAFAGCTVYNGLTIPATTAQVGAKAFDGTPILDALTGDFAITEGGVLLAYRGAATDVTVPEGVVMISALNADVTKVSLPETVITISAGAFRGCRALTEIALPKSLKVIGANAFTDCEALSSFVLPANLETIDNYAFSGCKSIAEFKVDAANKSFYTDKGVLYNNVNKYLIAYPAASTATSYAVPYGAKRIAVGAFRGAQNLESLDTTAAEEMTRVEEYGLADCPKLKSVKFHENFLSLGDYAFMNCTALTDYATNYKMTEVGKGAFMNCTAMTKLELAQPIAKIGEDVFKGTNMEVTVYAGSVAEAYAKGHALNINVK